MWVTGTCFGCCVPCCGVSDVYMDPSSDVCTVGNTEQFHAAEEDCDGGIAETTGGTWSSSNTAVMTVNSSGLMSAVASGSATLSFHSTLPATSDCGEPIPGNCPRTNFQATAPITVPACPTSITISDRTNIPLEKNFPTDLTGIGMIASMLVGPSTSNFNGAQITESVTTNFVLQQTCPSPVFFNSCSGSDTFTIGNGGSLFGVTKLPATNTFYDLHSYLDTISSLDDAHINSCTTGCSQTYSCNGVVIGGFTIIRNFTKDTIQGTPVTRVSVTKE